MKAVLIDFAASIYNALVWAIIPFAAAALAYRLSERGRVQRLREMALDGTIKSDQAWRAGNHIEGRALMVAATTLVVVGLIMAFVDGNMHAIVRAAHQD
jgi:hypothetical protein